MPPDVNAHDSLFGEPVANVALCPGLAAVLSIGFIIGDETRAGRFGWRQLHLDAQLGVVEDLSKPVPGLGREEERRQHRVEPGLLLDGQQLDGLLWLHLAADEGETRSENVG